VTDDVKAGTEAELLKVEVVDEVKTEDQDAKTDEKADTLAADEEAQVKDEDETPAELSVDVDKDSKYK